MERKVASTGDLTHNHQVMSLARSPRHVSVITKYPQWIQNYERHYRYKLLVIMHHRELLFAEAWLK